MGPREFCNHKHSALRSKASDLQNSYRAFPRDIPSLTLPTSSKLQKNIGNRKLVFITWENPRYQCKERSRKCSPSIQLKICAFLEAILTQSYVSRAEISRLRCSLTFTISIYSLLLHTKLSWTTKSNKKPLTTRPRFSCFSAQIRENVTHVTRDDVRRRDIWYIRSQAHRRPRTSELWNSGSNVCPT